MRYLKIYNNFIIPVSPFGYKRRAISKIRWSKDERIAVLSFFHKNIDNKKLPSFKEINEVKLKYPVLKSRTNAQIKTWIHNQIKKKI